MFINLEHNHVCEQVDNIKHLLNIVRHLNKTPLDKVRKPARHQCLTWTRQAEMPTESRRKWRCPTFESSCLLHSNQNRHIKSVAEHSLMKFIRALTHFNLFHILLIGRYLKNPSIYNSSNQSKSDRRGWSISSAVAFWEICEHSPQMNWEYCYSKPSCPLLLMCNEKSWCSMLLSKIVQRGKQWPQETEGCGLGVLNKEKKHFRKQG